MQWEPGYRIVELPTKWTARITNKETGEPKRVNVKDIKLKDPAEDWDLKADSIGRGAKFVNSPTNLPDIDWVPELRPKTYRQKTEHTNMSLERQETNHKNLTYEVLNIKHNFFFSLPLFQHIHLLPTPSWSLYTYK